MTIFYYQSCFENYVKIVDVAIGAPYEDDGWGAVYIYNGCPTGLATKPSQIISARQVYDHLRGFGYSISNPADIDANGYKGKHAPFY